MLDELNFGILRAGHDFGCAVADLDVFVSMKGESGIIGDVAVILISAAATGLSFFRLAAALRNDRSSINNSFISKKYLE